MIVASSKKLGFNYAKWLIFIFFSGSVYKTEFVSQKHLRDQLICVIHQVALIGVLCRFRGAMPLLESKRLYLKKIVVW